MKDWQRIRHERTDLTDYVVHFTKSRSIVDVFGKYRDGPYMPAKEVFKEILEQGFIRPTFAPIRNKTFNTVNNTVRGPAPAVCLTEQPLSAILVSRRCASSRYSGFGIAYHKYALHAAGGRPVIYGSPGILGRKINEDEPGYKPGHDIYTDGLPVTMQYLWVRYDPWNPARNEYPIDFTWEREWRISFDGDKPGLSIALGEYGYGFPGHLPIGALIVEKDDQLEEFTKLLALKAESGILWAKNISRIISLETVKRKLDEGDKRYARIETLPENDSEELPIE